MENIDLASCVAKAKQLLLRGDYQHFLDCLLTLEHKLEASGLHGDVGLRDNLTALRSCLRAAMSGLSSAYADNDDAKLAMGAACYTQCHLRL